ncbi:MAG: glycosyltransferase family 2 protein [Chitinispirillales bacterium]|jgi:glycosyltransferase involved in cell wall biosynthesis|nr:glycosyltransferase family 2 protein [Chitinispirillales bacterium]
MIITEWPKDTYVLVPSYKSLGLLRPFIKSLAETVPKEYICVVDDASGDGTYEFCIDFGVDCVRHSRNRGKGAALRTGFSHLISTKGVGIDTWIGLRRDKQVASQAHNDEIAHDTDTSTSKRCKWILTMDADGQHSPTDIPRFLAESKKNPASGICIGVRDMRPLSMPPARILSNRLTSLILSLLTGRRIADSQCGYRLYPAEFIKSIQIEYNRFQAESELIQKAAAKHFPIRFTDVQTLYLKGGSSHISHLLDTLRWIAAVGRVWFKLTFTDGRRDF